MFDQVLYRQESDKSFEDLVRALEVQVTEHKFRVMTVHDVQKTLAEKGLKRGPLKIIEVCNAAFADKALSKSINVALFMPCKFTVYPEGGKTVVNLARPTMISRMIPNAGLEGLASEVEEQLKDVIKAAL